MKRTRTFMPFRHLAPIAVLAVAAMAALEAGQANFLLWQLGLPDFQPHGGSR